MDRTQRTTLNAPPKAEKNKTDTPQNPQSNSSNLYRKEQHPEDRTATKSLVDYTIAQKPISAPSAVISPEVLEEALKKVFTHNYNESHHTNLYDLAKSFIALINRVILKEDQSFTLGNYKSTSFYTRASQNNLLLATETREVKPARIDVLQQVSKVYLELLKKENLPQENKKCIARALFKIALLEQKIFRDNFHNFLVCIGVVALCLFITVLLSSFPKSKH